MKLLILLSAAMLPLATFAGDAAAGKEKASTCASCHGADGISANSLWPNLAGQQEQYLIKQLKAFREGERTDREVAVRATTDHEPPLLEGDDAAASVVFDRQAEHGGGDPSGARARAWPSPTCARRAVGRSVPVKRRSSCRPSS